jgi:hypothetical protein
MANENQDIFVTDELEKTWIREYLPETVIVALFVLLFLGAIIAVILFGWGWTGFVEYETTTETYVVTATPVAGQQTKPPEVTVTTEVVPTRLLWDWMGLLGIPLVLALGGFLLTRAQRRSELRIAAQKQSGHCKPILRR